MVVTGGESGIGRAIAARCAADGAGVAVAGIDEDQAAATAAEIESGGGTAIAIPTDVREQAQLNRALDDTIARFGRLDGVVANAGVSQRSTPFTELTRADWQAVLDVNMTGVFLTLQAATRRLIDQGQGGCLIVTGSSTVLRPHGAHEIGYVAAKGAVHTMIRALAFELASHKIRVNAIVPGMTDTPMTRRLPGHIERGLELVPMGELVQVDELGALAAFMISDDARHMTGSIIQLDAGRTAD